MLVLSSGSNQSSRTSLEAMAAFVSCDPLCGQARIQSEINGVLLFEGCHCSSGTCTDEKRKLSFYAFAGLFIVTIMAG